MHRKKLFLSLNRKLTILIAGLIVPMILLIGYILFYTNKQRIAYDQLIRNITDINEYHSVFKSNIDSSMYSAVTGRLEFDELGSDEYSVPVYTYIAEVRKNFTDVSAFTTTTKGKEQLRRLQGTLDTLEERIKDMEKHCGVSGYYDKNMQSLESDIYVLTSIIQQGMQDYTYYETTNFEIIREDLEKTYNVVTMISIIFVSVLICLVLILSIKISKSITKPIKQLCDATAKIADGDFSTRTEINTIDEVAMLTDGFNHMAERIGILVADIEREQKNLRKTEIKLLQAQINPHFLYNTLDTIMWLVEQKNNQEAVQMITSLSQFFRTTLSEGRDFITVLEEKEHVHSYLEIQQVRYQDIMDYTIIFEKELYQYHIPKLLLQPLVENALYHGIKNKRRKGFIAVKGIIKNEMMIFSVKDNGKGMSKEEITGLRRKLDLKEHTETGSFGLRNVNERIKNYYGDTYALSLKQNEEGGITAFVKLPAKDILQIS